MADPNGPTRPSGFAPALELMALLAFVTFFAVYLDAIAFLPLALLAVGAAWLVVTGSGGPPRPIPVPVSVSNRRG